MCFYSEPKVVAKLLRSTADLIDKIMDDELLREEDQHRLSAAVQQIEFEMRGVFKSHTEIDMDALIQQFL